MTTLRVPNFQFFTRLFILAPSFHWVADYIITFAGAARSWAFIVRSGLFDLVSGASKHSCLACLLITLPCGLGFQQFTRFYTDLGLVNLIRKVHRHRPDDDGIGRRIRRHVQLVGHRAAG